MGNKQTIKELAELKETVLAQKAEIAFIKITLASIKKQCGNTKQELAAAKKHIKKQKEEIGELCILQDQLEQCTRKENLEINGIPENAYTSTEEVVLKTGRRPRSACSITRH